MSKFFGRRSAAFIGVLGIVAGMGVADRFVGRPSGTSNETTVAAFLGPVTSPASSDNSTWFCGGGAVGPDQKNDLIIAVSNPTDREARGTVTYFGDAGENVSIQVQVPPLGRTDVSASDVIIAQNVAALVELDIGGVGVDRKVDYNGSVASGACSSSTSSVWHLPIGATTRDAKTRLSVFNPFPEDALVDISFTTESGGARPTPLQGLVIPARSVRVLDVGSYVRRRSLVASTVRARVGRIVVDEVFSMNGSGGPRGLTVFTGTPSAGNTWYFPQGRSSTTLKETYSLYNPTNRDLSAIVEVVVDGAEIEPFDIEVPAQTAVELVPLDEPRIPRDVDYSVVVATKLNSLVVARQLDARSKTRRGLAVALGGRIVAEQWLVPDAVANATRDDHVTVLNPTDTATSIDLAEYGDDGIDGIRDIPGAQGVLVPGGGRIDIRLGDLIATDKGSIVVSSDGVPVVVERSRLSVKTSGKRTERPIYPLVTDQVADATSSDATPSDVSLAPGDSTATGDASPTETSQAALAVQTRSKNSAIEGPPPSALALAAATSTAKTTTTSTTTAKPTTTVKPTTTGKPTTTTTTRPAAATSTSPTTTARGTTAVPTTSRSTATATGSTTTVPSGVTATTTSTSLPSGGVVAAVATTSSTTPKSTTVQSTIPTSSTTSPSTTAAITTSTVTTSTVATTTTTIDPTVASRFVAVPPPATVRIGTSASMAIPIR